MGEEKPGKDKRSPASEGESGRGWGDYNGGNVQSTCLSEVADL